MNILNEAGMGVAGETCPAQQVEREEGWPPLPGESLALRYQAPVAVCTLTDENLYRGLGQSGEPSLSLAGALQTENLGIERVITNVLANPNIRFLILCGADSRRAIGHLPGQSLLALAQFGIDERGRIRGAKGKRPVLKNVSREAVEQFRRSVEVVDLIGVQEPRAILDEVRRCAARDPGPAQPFLGLVRIEPVAGHLPERTVSDPAGYFVIYVSRSRGTLSLEHYRNEGVLDVVIEGRCAAELYTPAIEKGLVSRLDHAAYLGKELARAEAALLEGRPYVQDGARGPYPFGEEPGPTRAGPASEARCSCSEPGAEAE